jgi:hypothetical protein
VDREEGLGNDSFEAIFHACVRGGDYDDKVAVDLWEIDFYSAFCALSGLSEVCTVLLFW